MDSDPTNFMDPGGSETLVLDLDISLVQDFKISLCQDFNISFVSVLNISFVPGFIKSLVQDFNYVWFWCLAQHFNIYLVVVFRYYVWS